jgi:hypothetical protein
LFKFHCDCVRGPYNPSFGKECGVLTHGHNEPPSISTTWNPPYYNDLLRQSAFDLRRVLYGYHLSLNLGVPSRVKKISDRLRERPGQLTVRSFNMKRLDEELRLVHRLYNETLDGKAVGFMLVLPNFNEILIRTKRIPHWLRLPGIYWLMKTHRIRTVRQVILGVTPAYRDGGLVALLCHDMVLRTVSAADSAELSWIESNDTRVIEVIKLMGGIHSRTYSIYEKPIAESPAPAAPPAQ